MRKGPLNAEVSIFWTAKQGLILSMHRFCILALKKTSGVNLLQLDDINGQIVSRGPRRVSFTFRKVRSGPCTCIFPEQCDSQQPHLSTLCPSNDDNVWEPCTTTSEDAYNKISYCAALSCNSETENSSESSSQIVPSLVKPFNSVTPEIEKTPPLVEICTQQGHEALVADALHLPYRTGFCDAAISIAVLHHLSNEGRRVRAIEELLRVVHKKGKVLITVWAVEQEDKKLLSKWTPLTCKYMDEWVDDVGTKFKRNLSTSSLGSIKEGSNEDLKELTLEKDLVDTLSSPNPRTISQKLEFPSPENHVIEEGDSSEMMFQGQGSTKNLGSSANDMMCQVEQQEYFVPWHLPYHRAEVGGASAAAVASGLAKKDDTKRAVVYNRYYHCFVQGELERLVSGVPGARIIDQFYDKSNWCVVIERL
jgi:SAM-dependent methyltransferase